MNKNLILLIMTALAFTACTNQPAGVDEATVQRLIDERLAAQPEGVFIHISAGPDDPHRVLMPLQMANMMAEGREVMVYFDIEAVEVVLKEAPDLTYRQFASSQTLLRQLLDKGVPMSVCPGCLQAAGHAPEDVMEGVRIAQKEQFFDFTKGRILTLDY